MSWWKHARPGDKVVCIGEPKDPNFRTCFGQEYPKIGEVVTVAWVGISDLGGNPIFDCVEWPALDNGEIVYYHNCSLFRPVQIKSTEIGMKILRKIAEGERVSA